jgi:hypothetical protein
VLGQGTRYSNVAASLLPQPTLLPEATITFKLVIPLLNAAFGQSVPSQILFSITSGLQHHTKTNTALYHADWQFKLVHEASLCSGRRTNALWGNLSPL